MGLIFLIIDFACLLKHNVQYEPLELAKTLPNPWIIGRGQ